MRTSVQITWWAGLIGALAATVAILKEVALVLQALRDINRLAEITREAAQGVATNTAAVSKFTHVGDPVRDLRESTGAIASSARSIEGTFDGIVGSS